MNANLVVSGTSNVSGNATFNTDYVIVVGSNTNIGSNTTDPQRVFSFPKGTYSSAKITAQVKTVNDANTQINEIVLAHDTTTSFLTVYGTVSSPLNSNLGVFSTAINTANVELYLLQSTANTKIKVVAHLIK